MTTPHQPPATAAIPSAIGRPALRALNGAGLRTLADVSGVTESELLAVHGVGPRAIRLLRSALEEHHLAFRDRRRPD